MAAGSPGMAAGALDSEHKKNPRVPGMAADALGSEHKKPRRAAGL